MGKSALVVALAMIAADPFMSPALRAQGVDCTIHVNTDAVATTNRELLRDFGSDIKDYVGNYNWGGGDPKDKVSCTLDVFVQSVIGDNMYSAQVFIGSLRPIYGTQSNTAVVRLFDESWEFTYVRNRPIVHDPYTYNDLASFLDFYMYLIMGYDFDSYDRFSGTPFFRKAADAASLGRASGQKGWEPSSSSYSRGQLIDEILSPTYQPVRAASWEYHFSGLDSLAFNPDRAYENILEALRTVAGVRKQADPRNIIIKSFFETKYKEIADIFSKYPDPQIYATLSTIDPNHQKTYDEYRAQRK